MTDQTNLTDREKELLDTYQKISYLQKLELEALMFYAVELENDGEDCTAIK